MPNWATRRQQKTRLPLAVDPAKELFKCPRYGGCTLTMTACANRYRIANSGKFEVSSYGECESCRHGKQHVAGRRCRSKLIVYLSKAAATERFLVPANDRAEELRALRSRGLRRRRRYLLGRGKRVWEPG